MDKEKIIEYRKRKKRVRTIFKSFRITEKYKYWSDLVLLNTIVITLNDLELSYSKAEIMSAFKSVTENDYDDETEPTLLKSLLVSAKEKSVF